MKGLIRFGFSLLVSRTHRTYVFEVSQSVHSQFFSLLIISQTCANLAITFITHNVITTKISPPSYHRAIEVSNARERQTSTCPDHPRRRRLHWRRRQRRRRQRRRRRSCAATARPRHRRRRRRRRRRFGPSASWPSPWLRRRSRRRRRRRLTASACAPLHRRHPTPRAG